MELPKDLREVEVVSTLDGSAEKCLLYSPEEGEKVPLLVQVAVEKVEARWAR